MKRKIFIIVCMITILMVVGCEKSTKEVDNKKSLDTATESVETTETVTSTEMEVQNVESKEEEGYVQPLTDLSQLMEWKNDKEHTEYSEVWFGSYPKQERTRYNTSENLWNQLVQADYDQNNTATIETTRYQRVEVEKGYRYFEYEPLKWRVLESDKDKIMLLSNDAIYFMKQNTETSWDKSVVRSWLNGLGAKENNDNVDYTQNNFLQQAFSEKEVSVLMDLSMIPELHEQSGIRATLIYFIGKEMETVFEQQHMNFCNCTEYAHVLGLDRRRTVFRKELNCSWGIRTKEEQSEKIAEVVKTGWVDNASDQIGVRPVICLETSKALKNNVCGMAGKSSAVKEHQIYSVEAFETDSVDETEYEKEDRIKLNYLLEDFVSSINSYFCNIYEDEDAYDKFRKSKKDENGLVVLTFEDIIKIYEDDRENAEIFFKNDMLERMKECENGTGWSSDKAKNQKFYLMYDEKYEYFTEAGELHGAWFAKVGEIFSDISVR